MKKRLISVKCLLRKCKTLSRQLSRSSSYSSLRSQSARDDYYQQIASSLADVDDDDETTVFVGSTRRRYVISSKYLRHPVLAALIDKSNRETGQGQGQGQGHHPVPPALVNCEVVLFDHLLWMLENADPNLTSDSLEELAQLYVY